MHINYESILVVSLALTCQAAKSRPSNAVLLSEVEALTFYAGKKTTHRRVSAVPQLSCVGGAGKGLYEVDVMRCRNAGSAYGSEDIEWTCSAQLPPEFKLGSTDVQCEGYESSDDPYVLKGSCGVQYRLALTEAGERKYGKQPRHGGSPGDSSVFPAALFWLVFIGVVGFMIYGAIRGTRNVQLPRGPGGGGWGGGGGGGGDNGPDGPPPPYSPMPPKKTSTTSTQPPSAAPQGQQPWRPGFYTGTALGAAAGAAASAFMNNRNANRDRPPGFGTFDGGNGYYDSGEGPSTRRRASSPRRSPPAPSTSRYESTGFGGTSRR